jgi:cytochrome c556
MNALPRLTGAFRAFADVSSNSGSSFADHQRELVVKRQQLAKKRTDTVSWQKLTEIITREADVSKEEVKTSLKELTQYAKTIGNVSLPY